MTLYVNTRVKSQCMAIPMTLFVAGCVMTFMQQRGFVIEIRVWHGCIYRLSLLVSPMQPVLTASHF